MRSQVTEALEHWPHVAPLLTSPRNDSEYAALVEALDEILDAGGADEIHPLATLADRIGDLIEEYENANHTEPSATGVDALRFLMQQHGVKQSDLPEVGSQSVVSELLSGRRRLNVRQIGALVRRFGVSADVFIDP